MGLWQLVIILLNVLNVTRGSSSLPGKQTAKLLWSLNALVIFLVVGTQIDVLRTWKFWQGQATATSECKPVESGSLNV